MAPPWWMFELGCYLLLAVSISVLYCIVLSPAYRAGLQAMRRQRRDAERAERIRKWAQIFPRKWRQHGQRRQPSQQLTEDIELQAQPAAPGAPAATRASTAAAQMHGGSGDQDTSHGQSHDLEDPRRCWYPEEYPPVQSRPQESRAQQQRIRHAQE